MVDYYDYKQEVPDLDVQDMREDFEAVWLANAIDVEIIRPRVDTEDDSDFFGTKTRDQETKLITKIFIQATPDAVRREKEGIRQTDTYNCLAKWDADIRPTDKIRFIHRFSCISSRGMINKGDLFVIENPGCGIKRDQYVFQEFEIRKIDNQEYSANITS